MKKNLFRAITISLFLLVFNQICGAQTVDDKSVVLQKCLDVPELQAYLPKNVNNTFKQVIILQSQEELSSNLNVSKFNQPVLFKSRADIFNEDPSAFLTIQKFAVTIEGGEVVYELSYNRNSESPKSINFTVLLEKKDNSWIIKNTTIKNN